MAKVECKACKFFEKGPNESGICRRFPPRATMVHYPNRGAALEVIPTIMGPEDWCGEWKRK